MKPHPNNFCGGNFQDWREVMLTERCNGKCVWCIEKNGFHPKKHCDGKSLAEILNNDPARNILLLGGEPSLFLWLDSFDQYLKNKNLYITTNGSHLDWIMNMRLLKGVNISIHHYDLYRNQSITGIDLRDQLMHLQVFQRRGIPVRFNCNLIRGEIDTKAKILTYIRFAKQYEVESVRFAELKEADNSFVDLAEIMNYEYGLNDDPFTQGCVRDVVIEGMHVNFRQMCGLQTSQRICPLHPEQYQKKVLYYDGQYYNGWMKAMNMRKLLEMVMEQKITVNEAMNLLGDEEEKYRSQLQHTPDRSNIGAGCTY